MNIYSLPALISFTINISIALIILLDNPKADLNKWFSAFVAMFAMWNLSEILILNSHNLGNAILAAQVLYRIIFLVPSFFVIIAYKFPRSFSRIANKLIFYILIFGLPVIFLILSFPDFQIQLIKFGASKNTFYYRLSYTVDLRFFAQVFISLIYFIWGIFILIRKLPKLKTVRQRNQTLFFLVGFLIIILLFVVINVFRPILEKAVSFYFLSTSLTFLISIFFLYVILHYKIFKIARIIQSGIIYSTLSSIVLAIYVLVIHDLNESVSEYFKINSFFFTTVLIIVLVFLMRPLERLLQNRIDNYLRKDIIKYRHNFSKFTHQIQEYKPLDEFFDFVKSFIDKNFFAGKTFLFVFDKGNNLFYDEDLPDEILKPPEYNYLVEQLVNLNRAVEIYEFNFDLIHNSLLKYFENHNIQIVVPFIFEEKLLAIIFIAKKKYADRFTEDEIERLTIMSNEVSLALHRNQMFEDLQKRIKERYRLEKLASIGQMTAGIAHEIRNPLNTISLSAQTLLRKNLDKDQQKELIYYISDEVDRLERTLKDFLKLSKFRNPKIQTVDLNKLLDKVIINIESKGDCSVILKKQIDGNNIQIETDSDLLFQVLLNLGLNAFEAIKERVKTDNNFNCEDGELQFNIIRKNQGIIIKVIDNGIGMEEKNKNSVFDPFFTTKEKGTGLGLSIAHSILESLNGKLEFNSKFAKTEFIIELPQTAKKQERD
ncbi:PTS system, cellobiose-specific IIC component [hydrothermal vent metagenome]|uniref:PTS system, cellobiose-specific IIC component n=1 Tax=hydrothermal vent metagenome TaxID=652676 RepID=A0A3B1BY07_9ZZZZ